MNMREMKDSGIEWVGNIPATWKSIQIKNLFTILSGATPTPDTDNWDGDVLWITPADYKTRISMFREENGIFHSKVLIPVQQV